MHQIAIVTFFDSGVFTEGHIEFLKQNDLEMERIEHKNFGTQRVEVINRALKTPSKAFVQCYFIESF